MKTLPELHSEVELGLKVYPTNTGDFYIQRFSSTPLLSGAFTVMHCVTSVDYPTFAALVADMRDAHLPIWSTTQTPAHIQKEQGSEYVADEE